MSCCVSKLDVCRLIQESYKSPTFNFGDTDVTNDTFIYKVKTAGESFTEYPCTVISPNIVVIDEYTLPVGNYIHEMLWISSNGTELIFQGGLKITSVRSCCGSNRNSTIKVIQNETVVRINYSERIIERIIEKGEQGDSAYQVAVENGFIGTESEWLESLKGEQGEQGVQGEQGIQGEQGNDGFNGWSPKFVFEEDGATRLVKKLDSWIGGTGTAPTDNVGMYVADGGYTSDITLAENFKGAQSDNLIVEYIHSGNKEVYIDSIDYDTNTFTSVGHGLVNGDRLGLNLLKQIGDANQSPFTKLPVDTMVFSGFYVVNVTTDTFQIATTNGGAPLLLINESTLDLSFFRFEEVSTVNLTFSEINFNDIEMTVVGGFARNPRYIMFKRDGIVSTGFTSRTNSFNNLLHDNLWSLGGTYSVSFTTNDKEEVRQRTWNLLQFSPMFNNGVINEIVYSIDNAQNNLRIHSGFSPYNGTTIKIYKL